MPLRKRKASDPDNSSDSDIEAYPYSPKRRRCDVLENGFAQLTLSPSLQQKQPCGSTRGPYHTGLNIQSLQGGDGYNTENGLSYTSWNANTIPLMRHSSSGSPPVILPGSVEEPTSPEPISYIPEVTMKSRSWYEPEKDREYRIWLLLHS